MDHRDAVELLRPAVPGPGARWADVGAGSGTFTRALAELLGPDGHVTAIDDDPGAVRALKSLEGPSAGRARVTAVNGDFRRLADLPAIRGGALDGMLFANALHYDPAPERILGAAASRIVPGGRIVVVEYDRTRSNPWVPYPLPLRLLEERAATAALPAPVAVARRPSRYQGEMYCAVIALPAPLRT